MKFQTFGTSPYTREDTRAQKVPSFAKIFRVREKRENCHASCMRMQIFSSNQFTQSSSSTAASKVSLLREILSHAFLAKIS